VSATVIDLVVVFAFFVFMLVLLCFCVATVFSVNEDINYFGEVVLHPSLAAPEATVAPSNATPRFQVTRTHLESSDNYHL